MNEWSLEPISILYGVQPPLHPLVTKCAEEDRRFYLPEHNSLVNLRISKPLFQFLEKQKSVTSNPKLRKDFCLISDFLKDRESRHHSQTPCRFLSSVKKPIRIIDSWGIEHRAVYENDFVFVELLGIGPLTLAAEHLSFVRLSS